jgi:hypothetical protein
MLADFDSGVIESNLSGDIEIIEDKTRNKNYFYGVKQTGNLVFPIKMLSEKPLDHYDVSAISRNFFNKQSYKYLQIIQPDLEGIFFKCMLINPKKVCIGKEVYGFSCDVYCKENHAWTDEFTYNYSIINPNQNIVINNLSDLDDYLYPYISFTTSNTTTSFSIKNITDNNREFKFTSISGNETIGVDNDRQIITSSTINNRLNNFNLKWLRLVSGNNNLVVNGNGSMFFKMRFPKKIGG